MTSDNLPMQPLLTIAIPTFNRAKTLTGLLALLEPQVAQFPQVEVLVSDNCSEDETPTVIAQFQSSFTAAGATLLSQRHAENIGADANFASLYRAARGRFLWVCGDDDLIVPGGLAQVMSHLTAPGELDLIYATSYGFRSDPVAERISDPLGRRFHTITNARTFARVVNIMFTFISGIIVNRERLESIPHEDPSAFLGTNLVQLSWVLPLLLAHRRSIVLWDRPVAARIGHANGYALARVFGEQLVSTATRLLPGRPGLVEAILNPAIQRWFPSILIEIRSSGNTTLHLDTAEQDLRRAFGGNFRYWLYTWPVLKLPLPLARVWQKAGAAVCKVLYAITLPGSGRKQT